MAVKEIMKDEAFLSLKCAEATEEDAEVITDLLDTFDAHRDECVGLAANMIGVAKCIIVLDNNGHDLVMVNPRIISAAAPTKAEEGCLSLEGTRVVKRFGRIRVKFLDADFKPQLKSYKGWTAEIIQHEIDHCNGVLV